MRVSELARSLETLNDDDEVFIETEDGLLHDFRCEERGLVFDGFDTVHEGGINLIMID